MLRTSLLFFTVVGCLNGREIFFDKDEAPRTAADSIIVDSANQPPIAPNADEDINTRFFPGLINGFVGNFVGSIKHKDACINYCGVGNPQLSSQCCGLGFTQCCIAPAGGFANAGFGVGHNGAFQGGFAGVKPGTCPGLFGFRESNFNSNPGFHGGFPQGVFRSADGASESGSRRRRQSGDSVRFGDETTETAEPKSEEVNPRFFGLFSGLGATQHCTTDYECPGQLKCCNSGFKSTCQQPSFFG